MTAEIKPFRSRAELRREESERTVTKLLSLRGKITKQQFDATFGEFAKQAPENREFIDAFRRALWPAKPPRRSRPSR